jgi:hypothetical protein
MALCAPPIAGQGDRVAPSGERCFIAEGFSRKTIYHSPQKPGYTSWVGAWVMPDKSLMVCFTQVTGQVRGRPPVSTELREKLGIPGGYDFMGLEQREIYLRSHDGGWHWSEVASTCYEAVGASAYGGAATAALSDGTLIRRVNGWDLMQDPRVPHTAFLQRSTDAGKTWGEPQVLLDPAHFVYQLSRIRTLRDGRLLASGQAWRAPAGSSHKVLDKVGPSLLLMASDNGGRTWERHDVVPASYTGVKWDEWDFAELPGGDLLAVFRRGDPDANDREVRWQGTLRRKGRSWVLEKFRPAPFPHSGHPELLATREGIVLHIATTGIHWTADAGEHWTELPVPGLGGAYRSRYYPRSLQTEDGRIHVFGHNGSDNRYGEVDQSIDMDTFRLAAKSAQ